MTRRAVEAVVASVRLVADTLRDTPREAWVHRAIWRLQVGTQAYRLLELVRVALSGGDVVDAFDIDRCEAEYLYEAALVARDLDDARPLDDWLNERIERCV